MKLLARACSILTLLTAVLFATQAIAHDGKHPDAPNPSPNATVSQEVGYTKISLTFGSPGVKGRIIWGELVPYGDEDAKSWVADANGTTTIEFEEDVKIDGHALPAGKYGLHVIPSEGDWIFIFSTDAGRFSIRSYTKDEDALRIAVTPETAPHQEWLTYKFEKTSDLGATLSLRWEKVKAGFAIEGPDHRKGEGKH